MTPGKVTPRLPERLLENARLLPDRYSMLWHIPRAPQEVFGGKTHREFYEAKFSAESTWSGRVPILEGDSFDQLQKLGEQSVGVFYVDGDHTYEGVCRDLSIIRRKIAPDGLIIMNDYIMRDHNGPYGVIQATNEFMLEFDWEMIYFCLEPNMYCDVVLRKNPAGG